MTCNHNLRWYELIPVLSFLVQSGKCRRCASRISGQYPIVELSTGLVFALISFHFMPILSYSQSAYVFLVTLYAFIFSILIVISVYDMRHKIIPDKLVYIFIAVSFLSIFVNHTGVGSLFILPTFMGLISGLLFAIPFALLWLVSNGRWIGLGDAKLVLGIGWMLGPSLGLCSVIVSFWIGSIVSLGMIMLMKKKKVNMKTEIPFAPFLILSALIVFLLNIDIITLVSYIHL